jgi:hypothetical protein
VIRLDRRSFLLGAGATGVLVSCGGGGSDDEPASSGSGEIEFLVPNFPTGFSGPSMLVPSIDQRVTFVLRDDLAILRDAAPETIELTITDADGNTVGGGMVAAHRDGIITPYYPVVFTPTRAGQYVATVAGAPAEPIPFLVAESADVPIVQIGDPMRSAATSTFDDARGVDPICTRAVPCPFHEISLDDALTSSLPTVLLMSTPGFCQTDICGPVLDLLIDAVGDRTDLDVIHAEIYTDPSQFAGGTYPEVTPVVATFALPYEPQLLVASAEGSIVGRLDTTWDRTELTDALASIS